MDPRLQNAYSIATTMVQSVYKRQLEIDLTLRSLFSVLGAVGTVMNEKIATCKQTRHTTSTGTLVDKINVSVINGLENLKGQNSKYFKDYIPNLSEDPKSEVLKLQNNVEKTVQMEMRQNLSSPPKDHHTEKSRQGSEQVKPNIENSKTDSAVQQSASKKSKANIQSPKNDSAVNLGRHCQKQDLKPKMQTPKIDSVVNSGKKNSNVESEANVKSKKTESAVTLDQKNTKQKQKKVKKSKKDNKSEKGKKSPKQTPHESPIDHTSSQSENDESTLEMSSENEMRVQLTEKQLDKLYPWRSEAKKNCKKESPLNGGKDLVRPKDYKISKVIKKEDRKKLITRLTIPKELQASIYACAEGTTGHYYCTKCKYSNVTRSNVRRHAIKHFGLYTYRCSFCSLLGNNMRQVYYHYVKAHGIPKKLFINM